MPGQSALEMGRRSAAMGDSEEGPSQLTQVLNNLREMATIHPTGNWANDARQLMGYMLPSSATTPATALIKSLAERIKGGGIRSPAIGRAAPTLSEAAGVGTTAAPAFESAGVRMPEVVHVRTPPTAPPAARGFDLGEIPPMLDEVTPDLTNVPTALRKVREQVRAAPPKPWHEQVREMQESGLMPEPGTPLPPYRGDQFSRRPRPSIQSLSDRTKK